VLVEQLFEPCAVAVLDGAVGEDERCLRQALDVCEELRPRVEAVAPRELDASLVGVDAGGGRDPVRTSLVVVDVGTERLLVREVDGPILGSAPWPI
jgi:hypothetical protein